MFELIIELQTEVDKLGGSIRMKLDEGEIEDQTALITDLYEKLNDIDKQGSRNNINSTDNIPDKNSNNLQND